MNVSRRGFLARAGSLVLATTLPVKPVRGQLEAPLATARFNDDGTLDLWLPNQALEQFAIKSAEVAEITPDKVQLHSQVLGGFFERHFFYVTANPFPRAIALAKTTGRPVKLIWSREEDVLREALWPLGLARFNAAIGPNRPEALQIEVADEGPTGRWYGVRPGNDPSAHEGLSGKPYAIGNKQVGQIYLANPAVIGYWRAVGHSMHDYMYESVLDEMANAAGLDPYEMRLSLLEGSEPHHTLPQAVADLAGGWQPGPCEVAGTRRARCVAMASPFGSEAALVAVVSIGDDGGVKVHQVSTPARSSTPP